MRIASSTNPACAGTELTEHHIEDSNMIEETVIRGIATRDGYHFFRAKIELMSLLELAKSKNIFLRFFQSADGKSLFLCEKEKAAMVREGLHLKGVEFEEVEKVAVLSAVGDGLSSCHEILRAFWKR